MKNLSGNGINKHLTKVSTSNNIDEEWQQMKILHRKRHKRGKRQKENSTIQKQIANIEPKTTDSHK